MAVLVIAAVLLSSAAPPVVPRGQPFPGCKGGTTDGCPGTHNCSVHWLEQKIDHFNWAPPLGDASHQTFQQRYFVFDQWWEREAGGPVFFYFGNEDNVELYVNHTGLMWESARSFGALMVWAEHRYYGETMPYEPHTPGCLNFLTTEQAMADFAYVIDHLRQPASAGGWGASGSAILGFGGSYGGMIAAWFRMHYPNAVDGVIAASAPIWSFSGLDPPYDFAAFAEGTTRDASAAGGATDACRANLKAGWPRILAAGRSAAGRDLLGAAFRTCQPVRPVADSADDPMAILQWAEGAWDTMAMGNFPYASSYIMHGLSLLPPWPIRAACAPLDRIDASTAPDEALFAAMREAAGVFYNNTGQAPCFDIHHYPEDDMAARRKMTSPLRRSFPPLLAQREEAGGRAAGGAKGDLGSGVGDRTASCRGDWGYQWCTEMVQPFTRGTDRDMYFCPDGTFYPRRNCSAWDPGDERCEATWGVTPRPEWARVALGGKRLQGASNIVFSNGLLDPWHGGGVLSNLSDSVLAVLLPSGAHHIDLMFSDPQDDLYPDIGWARQFEREQMARWVAEHALRRVPVVETATAAGGGPGTAGGVGAGPAQVGVA